MKSDSKRQTEYQARRALRSRRLTVWLDNDAVARMDELRGEERRSRFMEEAIYSVLRNGSPLEFMGLDALKRGQS